MPFTVSHIAAVLPLPRRRLLFSALVIGSMAPDLPHIFLQGRVARYAHTLPGLFLVAVPLGFAILMIFHSLLRRPLISIAPDAIRLRVPDRSGFTIGSVSQFAMILLSVLIGAVTHILWDSFTHANGFLVPIWPLLRKPAPFWPHRPVYLFLQPFFSVVGLAAIAWAVRAWMRRTPMRQDNVVPPVSPLAVRVAVVGIGTVVVVALAAAYAVIVTRISPVGVWTMFARFLFGSLASGFFALLTYALWWHLWVEKKAIA